MPATPEPMSIYHPAAAMPRAQSETTDEPSRDKAAALVAKAIRERERMRKLVGRVPPAGVDPEDLKGRPRNAQSLAARVREHIREHGPSTAADIAHALGVPTPKVSDTLGSQKRYGTIEPGRDGLWQLGSRA